LVQGKLELEWSPEQIAAWLRREFPDQGLARVPRDDLHGSVLGRRWWSEQDLDGPAAHRPPAVERRRRTEHRRARFSVPIVLIDKRPAIVEDRTRIDDWEGDMVRHEALCDRAEVGDLRRCAVAAA